MVGEFMRLVDRVAGMPSVDHHFAPANETSIDLPAIEAHYNFRFDDDPASLARSLRLVAGDEAPGSPTDRDIVHFARAVGDGSSNRYVPWDGIGSEAWLRWNHARLTMHHPDMWPGLVRPANRVPQGDIALASSPPGQVAGTLRALFPAMASRLPPGGWRATIAFLAIARVHPFVNANKRLARFVANRELAAAGLMPHVNVPGLHREIAKSRSVLRQTGDATPIAMLLASASRRAAVIARR
jgi:hypothetical protein